MAAVAAVSSAAGDLVEATDLLQKLSLDSQKKNHDSSDGTKTSINQHGSVNSFEAGSTTPSERSLTPLPQDIVDLNVCYLPNGYPPPAYYYRGYDGDRYVNRDGLEMPTTGVYGDFYQQGYGYASYGTYTSPGSQVQGMLHDGQIYGPQNYQYTTQFYQSPRPSSATYTSQHIPTSQGEVSTTGSADQLSQSVDATKPISNGIANVGPNGKDGSVPARPNNQTTTLSSNGSYGTGTSRGGRPSGHQDPRFGYDRLWSPAQSWSDGPMFSDGQHRATTAGSLPYNGRNQSARNQTHSLHHPMGQYATRATSAMGPASPGFMNRMYPNNQMYGQYGNSLRLAMGFGPMFYDSRTSGPWNLAVDGQYKPRNRGSGFYGYRNENLDELNELHRGPRGDRIKNHKGFGPSVTIAVKGQNLSVNGSEDSSLGAPDKNLYNEPDFPENYSEAKFFVIKSYSEDDIHKSVKYNVWASTPNGNKRLDAAYQEGQEKAGGCPVFLFFSVNTSGQFVGVAEMVGPVDFNKTLDYWQQDKWNGCFPVKWHIVKDVPNSILKHITLDNNDNKPVTNSRDTQEVKLEQGLQMLKLFKEHVSKTCILDDFGFYENRQKLMKERRIRQQLQKQVTAAALGEKEDGVNDKARSRLVEPVKILTKEAAQGGHGERKPLEENTPAVAAAEPQTVAKAANDRPITTRDADV